MDSHKPYSHAIWRIIDCKGNGHVIFLLRMFPEQWQLWHKIKHPGSPDFSSLHCSSFSQQFVATGIPEDLTPEEADDVAEEYIKIAIYQDLPIELAARKVQKIDVRTNDSNKISDVLDWLEATEFASIDRLQSAKDC